MKIRHVEGSIETVFYENGVEKQPYDLFVVRDESNGVEVEVRLMHADDNNPEDKIAVSNHDACMLSGINGSLHLSACVSMTILKYFTDGHSFYFEGFYDEDGNPIERDLIILPL